MSPKPFYITTTLPYVNADPHVGFAVELVRADIIARSKRLAGYEVFFNTGTDEHGSKVEKAAIAQGIDTQKYVDEKSEKFRALLPALGIASEEGLSVNFIRTTDAHHISAAQEFWRRVDKGGFIYKKNYSIKYCVGCELEKTDSELVDGHCPLHPLQEIEVIDEENYFFKFSAFQNKLLELYKSNPSFVVPDTRMNEIRSFVERGLEDFSISRLKSKMSWGIPVPGDDKHVMYVWFDALVDYISAIGWPDDDKNFHKWWVKTGGVVQYCGKDNLRQQAAMWQAMLMAAELSPSQTIVVDGFITGEGGLKMSKSLGNTVDPLDIIKNYGTDALRYYAARELHPFEDSPFTMEKFKEAYNAGLANGLGNLVSRIMKMAQDNLEASVFDADYIQVKNSSLEDAFEAFDLQSAMNAIWREISLLDEAIQKDQPFKLIKEDKAKGIEIITRLVKELFKVAKLLEPFLPETSSKIQTLIKDNKMPAEPLFMRK